MCGIAGIVGRNPENRLVLASMLDIQKHRGPDALGTWADKDVFLGHNRLSILDLSEAANQPMLSNCGRFVIIFNGEIYNYLELKQSLDYSFRTKSDTEVLLAMYIKYQDKMLNHLNGMFAFAIWDIQEKKFFAARDRFGVKPFYYSIDNGQFLFASEIKTLLAAGVSNAPNEEVWADYFVHGSYGFPEETFFRNIHQLSPGHSLTFRLGDSNPQIRRYYDFVSEVKSQRVFEEETNLQEEYLELLLNSLRLRFRSDVPVGFNVSGGLDSSILLAMISKIKAGDTENIEAFSFYTGDDRYDELPWVKDLISKTNSPLNPVLLSLADVPDLIDKVTFFQDEPYGGFPTLAYSKIFERARQKGFLVLLDGQGMDEAWAGYDYYKTDSKAVVQGIKNQLTRPNALSPELRTLAREICYPEPFDNDLQNKQFRDLFYTKIPRALRFNDRVSMMHSTELREPFLDYRLVEMAFAQKKEMKIRTNQGKWLPRQLVKKTLENIALAPKRPLQTPQREWIGGAMANYVEERIDILKSNPWFERKVLEQEWKNYKNGQNDNSFFIWQWINSSFFLL
ncbi:MAG: asparagine synthase (glutamine-hydrolyzing) [Algoriphagus sp.]|uniref:asparagine synthase (glutamine-hydrolyzing) n=1 Tax=Algoriphagus sp. TaxID=1872435 RepID=UPI0018078977|nr:asparagine synthase (glutamine-hydrolyzing) [Algoriphagus sp.]NVJ86781.1 asparagine synthase (glutamine-hydrolyzing) [Algoriphagus sp.]